MDRKTNGTSAILPFDVNKLLVEPVTEQSIAMQVFRVIPTALSEVHLPVVTDGASAEFVDELETYGTDSITLDTITVRPRKIGKTIPASVELIDDSDPAAAELIGGQLSNAIASAVDRYTWGNQAASAKAFAGIDNNAAYGSFTNFGDLTKTAWNLDNFIDAQATIAGSGKTLNYYVANSKDIAELNKIKESTGSQRNVLQSDPTQPGVTVIGGVPIVACDVVPVGTIWAINSDSAAIVLRTDSSLEIDRSVGFLRDEIVFKANIRVAFGVLDPTGIVKLVRKVA